MSPSPSPEELERMREKSGHVTDNRPLVTFLYKLMRDEVTPGRVEEILLQAGIDEPVTTPHEVVFTNGWLASYAQDLAWRLTGWDHPWPVSEDIEVEGGVIRTSAKLSAAEMEELKQRFMSHKDDPPILLEPDGQG